MNKFTQILGWAIVAFFAGWTGIALFLFALVLLCDDSDWDEEEMHG